MTILISSTYFKQDHSYDNINSWHELMEYLRHNQGVQSRLRAGITLKKHLQYSPPLSEMFKFIELNFPGYKPSVST